MKISTITNFKIYFLDKDTILFFSTSFFEKAWIISHIELIKTDSFDLSVEISWILMNPFSFTTDLSLFIYSGEDFTSSLFEKFWGVFLKLRVKFMLTQWKYFRWDWGFCPERDWKTSYLSWKMMNLKLTFCLNLVNP